MPKIMIIDDDATIHMELEEYLTHMDYTVVGTADTGAGAVELAREVKPDLILMDINLSGEMDGISAAQKIKEEMDAAVVFITGFDDPEYIERAKMVEPFGYVMKPFDETEINGNIKIALHKRKLELELAKVHKKLKESENRYRDLVEQQTELICRYTSDFKLTFVNNAYCRYFGRQYSDLIGSSFMPLMPEENREKVAQALYALLEPEVQEAMYEHQTVNSKGETRWMQWNNRSLYDSEGRFREYQSVGRDISARKFAEKKLRESEERFRTVANFTHDWEYWVAPDGRHVYASPSCERITGYAPDAFINDPGLLRKMIHPDDLSIVVKHANERENRERLPPIDFRITTRKGEERWISHVCQAVYSSDGVYLGRRGSNRDISNRKQMEAQLQQANKMEAIASLAGGVAHEFNNALMGVMGNLELLEMDLPKDERRDKHFKGMKDSGYRMSRLTDQLLAYSQGGKYQPRELKLDDFVIETLPILQYDLSPKVRVGTHFQKDISHINADHAQMQMVLSAILANSNEAVEDEGFIKITAGNKDVDEGFAKQYPGLKPARYVCLTVEDSGKGMNVEEKEKIFEPFFTTKFQGRGMGMAAVYGIVKNHDGWIYVDSELGKGTVVSIYLPVISAGIKAQEPQKVKEPKGELAMGEGTILVIEDEAVLLKMSRKVLKKLGYRVLEAKTGGEGVETAKTFDGRIDLALLDIKLPDMSGVQVYPLIMEARPDLKVLVCSGYSIDGPARKILDAGAEGFIQKPFLITALAEKLKAVLEGQ